MRWREWGNEPGREDLGWWVDVTAREAGRDALPVTWVAIDDRGRAVGAVGLDTFDLEERQDRSPWLVGMIVASPLRGSGIGGALVQRLKEWARDRGHSEVWVATGGRAVDFYEKYGWRLFEVLDQSSGESTILKYSIEDPRPDALNEHLVPAVGAAGASLPTLEQSDAEH
jgi:GNAT superfamily N-acetyltransferase